MNTADYFLQSSDKTNVMIREDIERSNERRTRILEQQIANERKQSAFNKFVIESKQYLLTESLYTILVKSIPSNDQELLTLARNIVESFVEEENCDALLSQFKTKTLYLSELANLVESTHREIIHGAKYDEVPFKIKPSTMNNFKDKLNHMSTEEISKAVMDKVAKAEAIFAKKSKQSKDAMEDLAAKTKEKIEKISHKDTAVESEMKQEATNLYHQKVDAIMNKPKSILESIIYRMAKTVVLDESLKAKYSTSKGKVDMNAIIEMSEVMYSFLEMLNTARIKTIDSAYINEVVCSIQ